eukprot:jgi/Astpho2/394/gw1.00011.238.1_t
MHHYKNVLALGSARAKGQWSAQEDELLIKAHAATPKGVRGFWTSLAKQVPGRTDVQCRERWCNVLDPDINQGPFTKQEDQEVASLVAQWVQDNPGKKKVHWGHIAKGMAGRTDSQVKRCWNRLEREKL